MQDNWTFGGIRLSSFGAVTELDSYLDMPTKRGDNILIPFKHGRVWTPKYFEQRTVSFGIEIIAGNVPELESKLDALKALVGSRAQQALVNTDYNGASRTAYAEVQNQLGVTRNPDPLIAKVVLDFVLADPFFRASVIVRKSFDIATSPYIINNPGTAEECNAVITFRGILDNPEITNAANGLSLQITQVIPGPADFVEVDCGLFTAINESYANAISYVVHSGAPAFMVLEPGDNVFTLSDAAGADTGTGGVDIQFYPPYL